MDSILSTVAKILVIPLVSVLTLAGYDVSPQTQLQNKITYLSNKVENIDKQTKLGAYNPTGGSTYRLQSSIGTTDTTIKLSSFKEPISNIPYTMSYLNSSVGYGTLDPQQPTRSEFISFTGITQNADGTATLTGVSRGMSRSYPYTASTTLRQSHSGQSIFILSDSPQHFAEYAVKANDETITGTWTFNNFPITASTTYASETVAGASELATGVEIASSTSSGGTTRRLTIPASLATSTYNSATAGLKVVVTGNDGKIDNNFLNGVVTSSGNNTFTGNNVFSTSTVSTTTIGAFPAWEIGKQKQIFTSSGNFTVPMGITKVNIHVVGAGGGGGSYSGAGAQSSGGGGGAGGYCFTIADVSATTTIGVTVGTGGSGTGGTSIVSSYCQATGGSRGASAGSGTGAAGGLGGLGSLGLVNTYGQGGSVGGGGCHCGGTGGASVLGGGAAQGGTPGYGGGGNGSSGSSGGETNSASNGGDGLVIITW